jgi:cytosine/adenosine deaminase-related metal-dependent hydrolase
MPQIIKNASLLLGKDLTFVNAGFIEIGKNGIIKSARAGNYNGNDNDCGNVIDAEGFLIIPGFINAHTHIGDSIGKDVAVDSGFNARIHPVFGVKKRILQKSKPEHLKTFIRSSAISMMRKGIVAFGDFREGGPHGIKLLKEAIYDLSIKCVILGRVEYYIDLAKKARSDNVAFGGKAGGQGRKKNTIRLPPHILQTVSNVLEVADGLGISSANENSDESLKQYNELLQKKNNKKRRSKKLLMAIHAAESQNSNDFSRSKMEVARIMKYLKPDIIVHMTNATDDDISIVAKKRTRVIVCPRANGILGVGIPRIGKMLKYRCIVGIGTDNVMLNSPDIFREMDYLWKVSRATEPEFITAREILKMATVNGAEILGLNSGCIKTGRSADIIFIDKKHLDLYPIHDPYSSVVHRASQDSIRAVMINGEFIDGVEL